MFEKKKMRKNFLLLFFIIFSQIYALNWNDIFHPEMNHAPRFVGSALFDIDVGIGNLTNAKIGCLGDFNSDKL